MSQLKKRKLKDACYLCQKDNQGMGCDGGRPCSSCKGRGVPHMCFGMEIGSGRDRDNGAEEPMPNGSGVVIEEADDDGEVTVTDVSDVPQPQQPEAMEQSPPPQVQLQEVAIPPVALPSFTPLASPFNAKLTRPLKPIPSTFSELLPKTTDNQQNHIQQNQAKSQTTQTPLQQQIQTAQPQQSQASSSPLATQSNNNEIPNRQNNLNLYFMKELCKLKNDQKRLDEQLMELKLENSNLSTTLKNSQFQVMRLMEWFSELAEQQQKHHSELHQPPLVADPRKPFPAISLPTRQHDTSSTDPDMMQIPPIESAAVNPASPDVDGGRRRVARTEQPMVVYDITKNNATVLTANATFCELLGYEMNEVIGMPWNKFIPPDAVARTMDILRQTDLNSVFQVEQVYRHKTSGVFTTWDTHTILFGNDGTPISDVVVLHLPGQSPGPPSSTTPAHPLIPANVNKISAAAGPTSLFGSTTRPRKSIGWKKREANGSSPPRPGGKTKRSGKRTSAPPSRTSAATISTPPDSPLSGAPSGLYPLTPLPLPLGSKPATPDATMQSPQQTGLFANTPLFSSLPLPEISTYPSQHPPSSTSPIDGLSSAPFFFQQFTGEPEGPANLFHKPSPPTATTTTTTTTTTNPTTTTSTTPSTPLSMKSIEDELSAPSFQFGGTSDDFPDQDDATMAAIENMDMDSILHFLNEGEIGS